FHVCSRYGSRTAWSTGVSGAEAGGGSSLSGPCPSSCHGYQPRQDFLRYPPHSERHHPLCLPSDHAVSKAGTTGACAFASGYFRDRHGSFHRVHALDSGKHLPQPVYGLVLFFLQEDRSDRPSRIKQVHAPSEARSTTACLEIAATTCKAQ